MNEKEREYAKNVAYITAMNILRDKFIKEDGWESITIDKTTLFTYGKVLGGQINFDSEPTDYDTYNQLIRCQDNNERLHEQLQAYKDKEDKMREYIKSNWVIDEPIKFKNDILQTLNEGGKE